MSFNYEKCKVMHFGRRNAEYENIMKSKLAESPHVIQKTLIERFLGLMISKDLKWVNQITKQRDRQKL